MLLSKNHPGIEPRLQADQGSGLGNLSVPDSGKNEDAIPADDSRLCFEDPPSERFLTMVRVCYPMTRADNLALAEYLLRQEGAGKLTEDEQFVLKERYRERRGCRDDEGWVAINDVQIWPIDETTTDRS